MTYYETTCPICGDNDAHDHISLPDGSEQDTDTVKCETFGDVIPQGDKTALLTLSKSIAEELVECTHEPDMEWILRRLRACLEWIEAEPYYRQRMDAL
jgi:hypothetical protein